MQVFIRFLAVDGRLPKAYTAFSLPDRADAEGLLRALEASGRAGAFCPAEAWQGLPEHVLVAADARMLRGDEPLREGQRISIIGQMIGG